MNTFIFLAGLVALIWLPIFAAIYAFKRQQAQQAADYKERRLEEEQHQWLEKIGLRETSFYFSAYGIRLLSIWSIRMTAAGIFK